MGAWLTTVDHKRIGILYGTTAFAFFLLGGLEALLMRAQLARPDNTLIGAQTYNELFTMHGTTMIFLAVMPLSTVFINFAVPPLIGARDVAFPRLNALSYWVSWRAVSSSMPAGCSARRRTRAGSATPTSPPRDSLPAPISTFGSWASNFSESLPSWALSISW
jgi:heme/copper-type cytochrome/quinol oxidase subunit 1